MLVCDDCPVHGVDFLANLVDHVLLFDFPKDPAKYVQRVGRMARTRRAGTSASVVHCMRAVFIR